MISPLRRAFEPPPNAPRFDGTPGHVESYFWRANDPRRPRALWLKATILAPLSGPAVAEAWFIWFDGERGRVLAHKQTVPIAEAAFPGGEAPPIEVGGFAFEVGPEGRARGELEAPWGRAAFSLRWSPLASRIASPLSLLRYRALREGPLPRSKLLTPLPALRFEGSVRLPDEEVELSGWDGMQGHNWGKEHAFEYAWGQCLFPEGSGPSAMVEGFTGRVRLGKRASPWLSALVVRRGEDEYRFDRLLDFWRQDAKVDRARWSVRLVGRDGEARLQMDAEGRPLACLGYLNPDGQRAYCFNSKLAEVHLQVQPTRGGAFELHSPHGGALELLRRTPEPALTVV